MERPSRRRLLAAVAASAGLAGCNANGTPTASDEPTPAPSDTATATPTPVDTPLVTASETPTPTPVSESQLEFTGSLVRQPTEEAPGRIRASLTNHANRTVSVDTGGLLPLHASAVPDPDDALLLYADQSDAINEYGWEDPDPGGFSYDGCWHAPGKMFRTAMAAIIDLPVGLSLVTEYTPLAGPDAGCPAGTYTGQQELTLRKSEQTLTVEITITVDADGRFSVSGAHTLEDA